MIAILIAFYAMVLLFAVMGSVRGWAKELLVIFAVILALAVISIIETLLPVVSDTLAANPTLDFWVRVGILLVMAFFGYQSPKISLLARAAERRDQIQDTLLGLILGAVSGYMIVGSLWWFIDQMGYFPPYIFPPDSSPLGLTAQRLVQWLPPAYLLGGPMIYVAVVLAFIFVIVVFI
jgi:hypothetical protein